jgi:MFS transporter, DHA2 family, methylenomycin A resistance protein
MFGETAIGAHRLFVYHALMPMKNKTFTYRERSMIGALALVFVGFLVNLAMFNVAIPQIRNEYGLSADATSWFSIVFNLPYILLMPFYGSLGDMLGKRRLLLGGAAIFAIASLVCFVSGNVSLLIVGRIIQGIGASAIIPLCLSILIEQIALKNQGEAIGTWNSFGPLAGVFGPLSGGLLIDTLGWRIVFIPSTVIIAAAIPFMLRLIPKDTPGDRAARALRSYDWPGFIFFSLGLTSVIFYVSSRVITGRSPLTDWRFLIPACVAITLFVLRERVTPRPFVDLSFFKKRNFTISAICVSLRMFLLSAISFLMPLFMTDALSYSAAKTGAFLTVNAVSMLLTMRMSGAMADRLSNRYPVIIGLALQALSFGVLAIQAGSANIVLVISMLAANGAGAGLSLVALQHSALHTLAKERTGTGAGLYTMVRFIGGLFGATVAGIVLERGIANFSNTGIAYRGSFIVIAAVAAVGLLLSTFLKEVARKKSD